MNNSVLSGFKWKKIQLHIGLLNLINFLMLIKSQENALCVLHIAVMLAEVTVFIQMKVTV